MVENQNYRRAWPKMFKKLNNINKKLKETVNALIAVRLTLNYRAKSQLYHSFFESHLKYAAVTYFDK